MSYVKEVMGEGEHLIYKAKFPWYQHALAWGALLILGIVIIGIIIFLSIMIRIWTTEIAVTSHRFILKAGWISRETEELSLDTIEEVNLEQGVLGRVFNFGRVIVRGSGEGLIKLPRIASPASLRKAIADAQVAAHPNGG